MLVTMNDIIMNRLIVYSKCCVAIYIVCSLNSSSKEMFIFRHSILLKRDTLINSDSSSSSYSLSSSL